MFKIGEFSKLSNTTIQALRYYEKVELLQPYFIDPESGYRFYKAKQLPIVNSIKVLQKVGLPLEAIKNVLDEDNLDSLNFHYQQLEADLQSELEKLQHQKKLLQILKNQKEGINMTNYNVQLKTLPERKVMSIHKTIPTYQAEGTLWELLHNEQQKQQVQLSTPPLEITIFHDTDYQEKNPNVEIQSQITGDYKDNEDVKFFNAPAMNLASVTFHGSFDQMSEVTAALAEWIELNDYHIAGPMINISHVSPSQDPIVDNWVTETAFVVAKNLN
ncbi:MerR family transcriptional regulator [Enterococcus sp. HY326]|uniref:MerR family transcriptional regulator n=1 Tax=Enterococcus sp. HY326 TaxID=2971265 RepID=UPI00223ED38A|nr:MerR family transcriptional regulator [Enterococcus sp. HY326]